MQFAGRARRSIRFSVFIGILAGSVFSGPGALAAFEILNQGDLEAIGNNLITRAGDYILMSDLTLNSPTSGASTYIAGTFTGTLDGNGKTLSGLTKPLFDALSVASSVNNLSLEANSDVGVSGRGLLANESSGTIENVHGLGDVNGGGSNYVGGLVGTQGLEGGEVRDSSFIGNVSSSDSTLVTGGLVGLTFSPITNSTTSGSVSGGRYVGGLAGEVAGTEIINSHSTSNVTASSDTAGGLLGSIESGGSVQNSSASIGAVLGTYSVGGLVGALYGSSISESFASGPVTGEANVGGLVGSSNGGYISQSYSTSSVEGIESVGGLVGLADKTIYSGTIRGVQATADGVSYCEIPSFSCFSSEIESSYSTGAVTATGGIAGGLVGKLYSGAIFNSYSTSNVLGGTTVGGLVGRVYNYGQNSNLSYEGSPFENYYGLVENSYATGTINIGYTGANRIGGLVGILNSGKIVNSYATAGRLGIDASGGCDHVGGLVGDGSGFEGIGSAGIIQDSFAYIEGSISAGCGLVGGLAGSMGAGSTITNSFAYVSGTVFGGDYAGGLIGYFTGDLVDVQDSYALVSNLQVNEESRLKGTFTVHVEWTGESFITTPINFTEEQEIELPVLPSIASVVNTDYEIGTEPFEVSSCLNSGIPYLKSLEDTYPRSDSPECSSDDGSGDTPPGEDTGGSEDTPPSDRPIRERVEREVREVTETRTSEKIEKAIGFKNENPLPKNAAISFIEATEKIDLAKVKAVEIAPTANVKVVAKAGEALQISLKSESKEPVELWVKSPDGSWLLAGVITFDKNGKAILPPLQFKNVGDYTLVLNKPSADSAKGSAPLNQSGSVLVAVS